MEGRALMEMDLALFPPGTRLGLLVLAAASGAAAVVLRWRRAREAHAVAAFCVAAIATVTLLGERLVALAAAGAAGEAGGEARFNEWRWVLLSPWGRVGIGAGIAVALATIFLAWRGSLRERSAWRRALLVGLRAGSVSAALILFVQPALELRQVRREPNHVAVLVDDSGSMALAETRGGPTRAERAARLVSASAAVFERWRQRHVVDFFTFSDSVAASSEKELAARVTPRGDASLLREALENVRSRYEGDDLAGVVVISDGIPTGRFAEGVEDGGSRDFLAGLKTRVHTVWAGRHGLADLSVARVGADDFAFVRTVVKVEAVVRATGLERRRVPITLERDGEAIRQTFAVVGGDVPEARVTFEFTPERVGKYVYRITTPVDPAETVAANNSRAFVLRVIRDKVRVLQVAGRPSWDERALRALLKSDPNVDLISFFILRTWDDVTNVPPHEMSLIPFPTEELFQHELGSFDLVVLMNFEHGPYQIGPYLENIRRFVEEGGALAMIGGDLAFSSGGYHGTPIAEVIPVDLYPKPVDAEAYLSTEEFQPRLTSEGLRHPVMQLRFDRRDNEARWNSLPPLEGLNLVPGAKPNATVLATHPFLRDASGRPAPVVVVGEAGKGRSLALLTDSSWHWGFVAAGRAGDDGRAYQKFWENAIRWLIRDPELEYLHVGTDQTEYAPREAPRVRARLVDKDYRPARRHEIAVTVKALPREKGETEKVVAHKKLVTDDSGEVGFDLRPPAPGPYRVTATAMLGGRQVAAEDVFLVNAERTELEQPAAREDVLRGIAAATGGRYLGSADALDEDLEFSPPRIVRVDRRTDVELWSRPYLLVLALSFLGAEWAIRRKSGYL